MAYYHKCLKCGSNLDPGETCDCQNERKEAEYANTSININSVSIDDRNGNSPMLKQLAELYFQDSISDDEYQEAETQAKRKLTRIIECEGDANGERLKAYYLARLVAEAVYEERLSNYYNMLHTLRTLEKKEMPAAKAAGQI